MQKIDVLLKEEKVENYLIVTGKLTRELRSQFVNGIARTYLEENGLIRKKIIVDGNVVEETERVDPRFYVEIFDRRYDYTDYGFELKKRY